ncbi:MAG: leucine-rich repeat domain-containing protein, partial [Clostridiaceae bacterium]|nr:leucine-rich repeat domain-containing protein [Clostridiaceae bacterium]
EDHNLDFYTIDETNIEELMGIDVTNYEALSFEKEADGDFFATILGKNKFAGYVACGSEDITYVEEVGKEAYCYTPIVCNAPNNSDTAESCFVFDEETNTITGYSSECSKDIGIPNQINGKDVIHIGDYAFEKLNLTSVSFPSTLRSVGEYAFYDNELTSLNLPNGLENIGIHAFGNNMLTCVSLPKSLKIIEERAFMYNQLSSIVIPVNVEEIGQSSFSYNPLTYARINGGNLINWSFENTLLKEVVFGPNVEYIGHGIFLQAFLEKTLIFPGNIKTIGRSSFNFDCSKNSNYDIYIRDGVSLIDENALRTCSNHTINNFVLESGYLSKQPYLAGTIKKFIIGENVSIVEGYFSGQLKIEELIISASKIGSDSDTDWGPFGSKDINKLTLKEGVQQIGRGAFAYGRFSEIIIPDSVTNLGYQAFMGGLLEKVTIGSGLKEISEMGFLSNIITSLHLGNNIEIIGSLAFNNNQLVELNLPSSVKTVSNTAFFGNKIKLLSLNEGLETIGGEAFASNEIENLVIPSTVTTIGKNAFRNNPIKSITILGDETRFDDRWVEIGFPINLKPGFEPDMCYEVTDGEITKYYSECGIDNVVIPSTISGQTITSIADLVFASSKIKNLTIPSSIINIGNNAFAYYNYGYQPNLYIESITIEGDSTRFNDDWNAIGFPLPLISNFNYQMCFDFSGGQINNYNISCSKDVLIPESIDEIPVASIGSSAFESKGIKSVVLPSSLANVSAYAFAGNQITNITIPVGLSYIGSYAFLSNLIQSLIIPEGIGYVDEGAFKNNLIKTVTIPEGVSSLANRIFENNLLTSVSLPEGMSQIGSYAFANNQIKNLVLPSNLSSVNSYAFYNNQLESVTLPEGMSQIYSYAFANNQIKTINFPSTLTGIGQYAFTNNQIITASLPSYCYVQSYAFYNNNLKSLTLPSNQSSISEYAYANNQLESVILPSGLTNINNSAFRNNNLKEIVIPESMAYEWSISDYAFLNNQFTKITILGDQYRFNLKWGQKGFPTELMPIPYYDCFDFEDGYINGYDESCRRNVTIPEMINGVKVIGIGDYAFYGENITDIDIPATITYIGSQAFNDNKLPDSKAFIYGRNPDGSVNKKVLVSYGGIKRTNVIVPEGIETINEYAFAGMG